MAHDDTRFDAVFCGAIEVASAEGRAAYIADACGPDEEFRRRVARLVDAHFRAGSFLGSPIHGPGETLESRSPAGASGSNDLAFEVGSVVGREFILFNLTPGSAPKPRY